MKHSNLLFATIFLLAVLLVLLSVRKRNEIGVPSLLAARPFARIVQVGGFDNVLQILVVTGLCHERLEGSPTYSNFRDFVVKIIPSTSNGVSAVFAQELTSPRSESSLVFGNGFDVSRLAVFSMERGKTSKWDFTATLYGPLSTEAGWGIENSWRSQLLFASRSGRYVILDKLHLLDLKTSTTAKLTPTLSNAMGVLGASELGSLEWHLTDDLSYFVSAPHVFAGENSECIGIVDPSHGLHKIPVRSSTATIEEVDSSNGDLCLLEKTDLGCRIISESGEIIKELKLPYSNGGRYWNPGLGEFVLYDAFSELGLDDVPQFRIIKYAAGNDLNLSLPIKSLFEIKGGQIVLKRAILP